MQPVCQACAGQNGNWTNERTISHYENLVFKIMGQFIRTYKIPAQEVPDFRSELMMKLVKMPHAYRTNSAGAYTVIKNGAVDWVNRYRRWTESEDTGHDDTQQSAAMNRIKDLTDYEKKFHCDRLAEQATSLMQMLPDPERICLTFHYGIGQPRPLTLYLISRKLGVTVEWVKRRIARGEFLLRKRVSGSSLPVRTTHARTDHCTSRGRAALGSPGST